MKYIPSAEQIAALLRTYLPALGALMTAYGLTQEASWVTTAEIVVGPLSIVIVGAWTLISNTREAILRKASKPVAKGEAPPQILLPKIEADLAQKLPDNVTSVK